MTTKLTSPFKRELDVKGEKYTLTVTPEGFKLVLKGKRKGVELNWAQILALSVFILALGLLLRFGDLRRFEPSSPGTPRRAGAMMMRELDNGTTLGN